MTTLTEGQIMTYWGRHMDPLAATEDDIDIHDIAHALALTNRYAGHTRQPYSVAQHSVMVCRRLLAAHFSAPFQAAGLMHDASEAYLLDVPRPLKRSDTFYTYRAAEDRLMRVIFNKFKLPFPLWPEVLRADQEEYEREETFVRAHQTGGSFWAWGTAEGEFLYEAHRLGLV